MKDLHDFDWSDLEPIAAPPSDGQVAVILYAAEYTEALDWLRALMVKNEHSERALAVTSTVIAHNPAHYSAWEFRYRILRHVGAMIVPKDAWLVPLDEPLPGQTVEDGDWINEVTLANTKNYQIWHYRQLLEAPDRAYYEGERTLVHMVLQDDPKHYHAWSHLTWLARRQDTFGVFSTESELAYATEMIAQDVRNNSAWNYRFYALPADLDWDSETAFVEAQIELAPNNEAPWNYIVGLYEKHHKSLADLQPLAARFQQALPALELLGEIYSLQKDVSAATKIYGQLSAEVPTRRGYFEHRLSLV